MQTGGARLRNAGPRHTTGVKTQSRGLARRKVSLGGAANACSRVAHKRKLWNTGCEIGLTMTMGVILAVDA